MNKYHKIQGDTPLLVAIKKGYRDIVDLVSAVTYHQETVYGTALFEARFPAKIEMRALRVM